MKKLKLSVETGQVQLQFVCASTATDLAKATESNARQLVKATNRQLVKQAGEYVFATGIFHEPLVLKHLRRPK